MKFILILLSCLPLTASAAEKNLPRVLLIGDSISAGYAPAVKKALAGIAEMSRIKGNGQHTGTGIKRMDAWLGDNKWDLIHFNWGLWDLCYRHPDSKVQGNRDKEKGTLTTSLDQYERNLEQLVKRLKLTGAILIWANTTVVPEGEAGRKLNDDLKYNNAAARVMERHGVQINDLNALTRSFEPEWFIKPGDVHFMDVGSEKLGEQVAMIIQEALKP